MLHRRLKLLLEISYYHLLLPALMAAPLNLKQPLQALLQLRRRQQRYGAKASIRVSRSYLLYSLCFTVALLVEIRFQLPPSIFDGYLRSSIMLQWGFVAVLVVREAAMLGCYALIWCRRQALLQLYMDIASYWLAYRRLQQRLAGTAAMTHMQLVLAKLLRQHLCVNYVMLACAVYMQTHLSDMSSVSLWLGFLVRCSHMTVLMVAKIGSYTMMLLVCHQFESVQLALHGLFESLQQQQCVGKLYYMPRMAQRRLKQLQGIAALHWHSYSLAGRIFRIYDISNALIFLSMFVSNVSTLYHAVQFGHSRIVSTTFGYLVGNCLIASNLWSLCMLMNIGDRMLHSCNDTGQVLKRFSDLHMISREFDLELECFATTLRSCRLKYMICGCVELNKSACLRYSMAVLVHVFVLLQFDLKRKQLAHNE